MNSDIQKQVLIITNEDDVHASVVVQELLELGRPVFRLNTETLLTKYSVIIEQSDQSETMSLRRRDVGYEINLENIGAVYFRRPAPVESDNQDETVRTVILGEANHFLKWLYAFTSKKWLFGDMHALDKANSKLLQMSTARAVGFTVPYTILGNNDALIKTACQSFSSIAIKSIREMGFVEDGTYKAFYTNLIEPSDVQASNLENNISFLQQAIPKQYELRITYVDGTIIPVKIHSQKGSDEAKIDWRHDWWYDLEHELVSIPKQLEDQITEYMQKLGLRFGAFDFIFTPDDKYVFLECNPNGQWLWLDEMTSSNIAKTIAQSLDRACHNNSTVV